ncbi:hypothetical protein V8F20_006644 [Naviculisporaceae sp. PSN 640]
MGNEVSRLRREDLEAGLPRAEGRGNSSKHIHRDPDPELPPRRNRHSTSSRRQRTRPFEDRLYDGAMNDRIAVLLEKGGPGPGGVGSKEPVVRLRVLQYMNLIHIKRLIAREVSLMSERHHVTDSQMDRVRVLMKDYVGALRDLQYMLEPASRFASTASFLRNQFYLNMVNDSAILECEGLVDDDYKFPRDGYDIRIPGYCGYGGRSYKIENHREFLGRLRVAVLTGLSLIAPMLFMKLINNLIAQLVTASAAVLVLGAILAYIEEMQKKDVVAGTAAYAAVLVVFIGTSG